MITVYKISTRSTKQSLIPRLTEEEYQRDVLDECIALERYRSAKAIATEPVGYAPYLVLNPPLTLLAIHIDKSCIGCSIVCDRCANRDGISLHCRRDPEIIAPIAIESFGDQRKGLVLVGVWK